MFQPSVSSNAVALLGSNVCKTLCDKNYEKRKIAALDIEQLMRHYQQGDLDIGRQKTQQILDVLNKDFVENPLSNIRKGGLLGLASAAIGLESNIKYYLNQLVSPVLRVLSDAEPRVRYYACEAMYNVTKVARQDVLLMFNDVFDGLCKVYADVDSEVRHGAQFLDRLVKSIVMEGNGTIFNVNSFISILDDRLKNSNSLIRQLIMSWITLLHSIPEVHLVFHLPKFLSGLVTVLGDSNRDIRNAADACLAQLLGDVKKVSDSSDPTHNGAVAELFQEILRIILEAATDEKDDVLALVTCLSWLHELLVLATPQSVEKSTTDADGVTQAAITLLPQLLNALLACSSSKQEDVRTIANKCNSLLSVIGQQHLSSKDPAAVSSSEELVTVLHRHITPSTPPATENESRQQNNLGQNTLRVSCLQWLSLLLVNKPQTVVPALDKLFDPIFANLSHSDDKVVGQALQVLAEMSSHGDFFQLVSRSIVLLFYRDRSFLEQKGRAVLRQLGGLMNVEELFITVARILRPKVPSADLTFGPTFVNLNLDVQLAAADLDFCHQLIQMLNWILLTSKETLDFRHRLQMHDKDARLRNELLPTWFHNPIGTLSLALWMREYDLACEIVNRLSAIEPTVESLIQLDQLVHLLESPTFCPMRLDLLDAKSHPALAKTMIGLAMIVPQASTFQLLQNRLQVVQLSWTLDANGASEARKRVVGVIKVESALGVFDEVLELHRNFVSTQVAEHAISVNKLLQTMFCRDNFEEPTTLPRAIGNDSHETGDGVSCQQTSPGSDSYSKADAAV